ncbi:hypothetical protein BsWGS_09555 [Bradybaena similaris]
MGDVTIKLNKTETGEAGGDDEDLTGMSGSGDGEDNVTYHFSSKPPGRSSPRTPSSERYDTGVDSQENLIVYIVSAAVIFAVVAIVIVIVVICCCRRRKKAKRARLASQGSEMKTLGPNKETRVFQNIAGGNTLNRQSEDTDQIRFLPPPPTMAPPPPSSSKARVAPEAEKLLKTISGRSDIQQPELSRLLSSEDPATQHHYEEIPSDSHPKRVNGKQDVNNVYETVTVLDDIQGNQRIKETDLDSRSQGKSPPVAKPRKSLEVIDVADDDVDGVLEARVKSSAV